MATPRRARASVTAGDRRATRSLTRHVRHHAAVTLMRTGRPAPRSAASRAELNGSHPAAAAVGTEDTRVVSGPSATAPSAITAAETVAAMRHDVRVWREVP